MAEMDEQVLEELYTWIDQIPLSRPKKDLKRDFSDGVLVAEVIKHYHPHIVELHNYQSALGVSKKAVNWHMLNRKVFKKLGFEVTDEVIHNITTCRQWAIEQFLLMLQSKVGTGNIAVSQHPRLTQAGSGDRIDAGGQGQIPYGTSAVADTSLPANFARNERQTGIPKLVGTSPQVISSPKCAAGTPAQRQQQQQQPMPAQLPQQQQLGGEVVPRILLEEKLQEVLAKDETIQILQAKIRRLEHLIQIKDIRIEDLQTRMHHLEMSQNAATASGAQSPSTRPNRK